LTCTAAVAGAFVASATVASDEFNRSSLLDRPDRTLPQSRVRVDDVICPIVAGVGNICATD
jgi:hypothetical protein